MVGFHARTQREEKRCRRYLSCENISSTGREEREVEHQLEQRSFRFHSCYNDTVKRKHSMGVLAGRIGPVVKASATNRLLSQEHEIIFINHPLIKQAPRHNWAANMCELVPPKIWWD